MEIYKDLSSQSSQEFEKLLSSQLSKIKIEETVQFKLVTMVSCVIVANAVSALAAQSKSLIFIQTKL